MRARPTRNIQNVIPRGDGYGPFPSFSSYTSALPDPCRGAFYALKSDGTVVTFAGTATKLYRLNNIDFTWLDVSRGSASYSQLSSSAQWQFAQTGNLVFATQANALLQVFDLTSSTAFDNALGAPPQAAYISVVGAFPGAVGAALDALSHPMVGPEQLQFGDLLGWLDGGVGSPGLSGRRHRSRRCRRRSGDHLSGSGDPAHVLRSGIADHLPDRPH